MPELEKELSRRALWRSSALVAVLLITGFTLPLQAQRLIVSEPPSPVPTQETTDQTVYKHFLRHVAAFSHYADERQQQGLSPEPFRHYFRRKLNLSPTEELDLNTIALNYVQALAPVKKQAAAILAAFHTQYPPGLTSKAKLPPGPPDFSAIKVQERNILQQHMNQWRMALDDSEYVRIHALIQAQITKGLRETKGITQ